MKIVHINLRKRKRKENVNKYKKTYISDDDNDDMDEDYEYESDNDDSSDIDEEYKQIEHDYKKQFKKETNMSDKEMDQYQINEYRKFLRTMFPSTYLNKKIKQYEKNQNDNYNSNNMYYYKKKTQKCK